jgi:hypothetical protein
MTVQELINELEKVENKNLRIRIHGEGPDGWTYYNEVEYTDEGVVYEDDGDLGGKYRKRFVISGGMF